MEFSPIPSPNLSLIKDKCNESDTQICLASSNKTYCLFDLVPPEIIREILIFLPIDDFIKSKRVCKLWNEITKDSRCYENVCLLWWNNRYSTMPFLKDIPLKECIPNGCDWLWLMKCFHNYSKKIDLGFCVESTNIFFGEFKKNELNGLGTFIYSTDGYYVGEWKEGYRNGQGKYTWAKDTTYNGGWVNGYRSGFGECHWPDGFSFSGNFKTGMPLDRSGCIHPLIQRCLSEKVCTSLVTKNTRQFGQIIYECNCGKSFCLSCGEDCHSLDIQEHRYLNETWVHCLDHCYCYYHPEKCLHRKHNK